MASIERGNVLALGREDETDKRSDADVAALAVRKMQEHERGWPALFRENKEQRQKRQEAELAWYDTVLGDTRLTKALYVELWKNHLKERALLRMKKDTELDTETPLAEDGSEKSEFEKSLDRALEGKFNMVDNPGVPPDMEAEGVPDLPHRLRDVYLYRKVIQRFLDITGYSDKNKPYDDLQKPLFDQAKALARAEIVADMEALEQAFEQKAA